VLNKFEKIQMAINLDLSGASGFGFAYRELQFDLFIIIRIFILIGFLKLSEMSYGP
jgi:hypothetical protein